MTTFQPNPTYYQVVWTLNSPTDYSSLSGTQAGGLDSTSAANYNRIVAITGNTAVSTDVMTNGETIIINGYNIRFDATMSLATLISTINLSTKFTNVIADQRVQPNYITLANAPGTEGAPFYIQDLTGSTLTKLGLSNTTVTGSVSTIGGASSATTAGQYIIINNVNVVMTGTTVSSAVTNINSALGVGVTALPAGGNLQLNGADGVPFTINGGTANSALGFPAGNYGAYPLDLGTSIAKSQANMRWKQTIAEMESFSSPFFVGNIVRTGNLNGNGSCTTFQFTVGYADPDQVVTIARTTEPDAGNVLIGTLAVKRSVARALTEVSNNNENVFDPTMQNIGPFAVRYNPLRIMNLTASPLDTVANIITLEQNISVTQIAGI